MVYMKHTLEEAIKKALISLGLTPKAFVVEHPVELSHGDYATSVALSHSKEAGTSPRELAEKLKAELEKNMPEGVLSLDIAGPGFINFHLADDFFSKSIESILAEGDSFGSNKHRMGKKVMIEYTQPNPFKEFHIGHLMSNAIGESLSRILQFEGAQVVRANYQGDVGPHVAKALWAILKHKDNFPTEAMPLVERIRFISSCYVEGSQAYEEDEQAKQEINIINRKVFEKSDPEINIFYEKGRAWTLEHFEELYKILGTKFDYYFFESETAEIGKEIVKEGLSRGIFEESDGATVFKAEKYDPKLHTRVFITSLGLPTYETKELGLTKKKFELENPDLSIVTTAIEQADYMKVVTRALAELYPDIVSRIKHVTHGMMRLSSGKMSSRKGNVITGESLITDAVSLVYEKMAEREFSEDDKHTIAEIVGVAAIKYSILKQSTGSDIVFDFETSISFEGDSGPYLQYSLTRARSVLEKAKHAGISPSCSLRPQEVTTLEKYLYRFPEIVARAGEELEPYGIAHYAVALASAFNSFYAHHQIVNTDDIQAPYKVALTQAFFVTMKNSLNLLGIKIPEKM